MDNTTTQMQRISDLNERSLKTYVAQQATEAELNDYWGPQAEVVRDLAREPEAPRKKGDSLIVLLPGLMGSTLADRGADPQLLWINPLAYSRGALNRLDLAPDGKSPAQPGVDVQVRGLLWVVYAKLLLRLQREHAVTTFPYDWRRATWDVADALRRFIDQKLAAGPFKQVTLVGHSLGGLLALDYLTGPETRAHAEQHVRRVIALGAPFRGTLPAMILLIRGGGGEPMLRVIQGLNANNDPLRMVRTFPSMYQILPAPRDLYQGWDPVPKCDIWNPETWAHQNVPIDLAHLKRAYEHHRALAQADPQVPIYCVVGALYNTTVSFDGDLIGGMVRRVLDGPGSGDGTVAAASAVFRTGRGYYVNEVHTELVLERTVIDAIIDWVEGGEPRSLKKRIEDVIRRDMVMRAASPLGAGGIVNSETIRRKAVADIPLEHAELQVLNTIF